MHSRSRILPPSPGTFPGMPPVNSGSSPPKPARSLALRLERWHRHYSAGVSYAKRDVSVRIPEEPVPYASRCSDRASKYKLKPARQRPHQNRGTQAVIIISSERCVLVVSTRNLMSRIQILEDDRSCCC